MPVAFMNTPYLLSSSLSEKASKRKAVGASKRARVKAHQLSTPRLAGEPSDLQLE